MATAPSSFRSVEANPFVYRRDESTLGSKASNRLFVLSDLTTSDPLLQGWTEEAGGAWLCVSAGTAAATSAAWAIIPSDNSEWSLGCHGQSGAGRGAYYGNEGSSAGWVGSQGNGDEKGVSSSTANLGLAIEICNPGFCSPVSCV